MLLTCILLSNSLGPQIFTSPIMAKSLKMSFSFFLNIIYFRLFMIVRGLRVHKALWNREIRLSKTSFINR